MAFARIEQRTIVVQIACKVLKETLPVASGGNFQKILFRFSGKTGLFIMKFRISCIMKADDLDTPTWSLFQLANISRYCF